MSEYLQDRIVTFGNEIWSNRPKVLFATRDTGSAQVIAPVIDALDYHASWVAYSEGKSLPVMEAHNFSKVIAPNYLSAIKTIKPDIVVTGVSQSGPGIERGLTHLAKRRNIPVVWVVDSQGGVEAKHFRRLYLTSDEFSAPLAPDYFCVQDSTVKDTLLHSSIPGINEQRIFVTGQPAFDSSFKLVQRREKIRSEVRQKLGLSEDEKTVLFAGQKEGTRETLEELIDALNNNPGKLTLAVRFHPRDTNLDIYPALLEKYNGRWVDAGSNIIKEADHAVISTEMTLSMFSTLNMSAIFFRIPTAYLLTNDESRAAIRKDWQLSEHNLSMVQKGAAEGIYQPEMINIFISNVFNNLEYVKKMQQSQEENYPYDGNSAARIGEIILQLAK